MKSVGGKLWFAKEGVKPGFLGSRLESACEDFQDPEKAAWWSPEFVKH